MFPRQLLFVPEIAFKIAKIATYTALKSTVNRLHTQGESTILDCRGLYHMRAQP